VALNRVLVVVASVALLCLTGAGAAAARTPFLDVPGQANLTLMPFPSDPDPTYGVAVVSVGDVNGDGLSDLASDAEGRRYVVAFGARRVSGIRLFPTLRGFSVRGASVVGGAGDVNGDGVGDLLALGPDKEARGRVYVLFGQAGPDQPDIDVASLGGRGFVIEGAPGDGAGGFGEATGAVTGAGDVNGDGRADIAITAIRNSGRGYAAVVFGAPRTGTVRLDALRNDGFRIEQLCAGIFSFSDHEDSSEGPLPAPVAAAGDVNSDGRSDVIIGLGRAGDQICPRRSGEALVIYGKTNTTPVDSLAGGSALLRIRGRGPTGRFVDGGKDVNGDRRPDLLIASKTGAVVISDARQAGRLDIRRLGRKGFAITGEYDGISERPLALLGDMTGDRRSEIAFGNHVLRSLRRPRSRSLARAGNTGYLVRKFDSGAADYAIDSIAPAGDVNGDRRADALIVPTELGPADIHIVLGQGPPLVEVAPLRTRILVDRSGKARFNVLCPANTVGRCNTTLQIITATRRILLRRLEIKRGRTRKVIATLPPPITRRLERGVVVNVRAIASSRTRDRQHATTSRQLALQRAASPP
jgi:hypothetical protein